MLDFTRYYRAYAEMQQTLDGDYTRGYLTGALADSDTGKDVLAGNAYNRVIDMDWVEKIEEVLPYMDKAIREDRKFIETYEEVDRVDKVKQVTKEAVRHLTQHTSLIQKVDPDGSVSPSKLLNTHREDSYATYENRFLYTLIFRTISFVEARFRALKEAPRDSSTNIEMNRDVTLNNQKFAYTLTYSAESHDRDKIDKDEDVANLTDYERIERIRMMLTDFVNTNLIQSLKGCIQVRSPINKTNCIKKNPNFAKCNELWSFIEAYRKTGYVVESNEYSGEMDADTQKELYEVMAFQHFVMTISTNKALKEKLHAEYVAENERRVKEANKPQEEQAKWLEEQIYEARREEMAIRLKEVRERELIIAQLTTELDQEKEKVRQKDLKIKELETLLNIREKELEETKEELRLALQRVAELETELEQCKAKIAQLEAKVEEQAAIIAAQVATIAALESKIVELNNTIEQLNAQIVELKVKVTELEDTVSKQAQTIKEQATHIDFLNDKVSVLETTVRDLNIEIDEHKARISELENICENQSKTIDEQASQIVVLNTSVNELRQANGALTAENIDLKSTVQQCESTIKAKDAEITEKTSIINTSNDEIANLSTQLSALQANFDDLEYRYENHQAEVDELNATINEGKALEDKLSHEIRVHLNMLSAKEAIINTLNDEKSALKAKVDGCDEVVANSKAERDAMTDKLRVAESECVALNNTLRTHVQNIKNRDEQIEKLQSAVDTANADRDSAIADITSKYEAQLEALKADYEHKLALKEQEKVAACSFTDEQKYSVRLNAEKKAIEADFEKQLKEAKKKAKAYVKKARVLIDYKPEKLLNLDETKDYQ
ncbi:MAG: hypothetical protein E7513_01720 [Ruminococcaceae bacterium]|nr:hypothetical protein [Oscillospiraceae bacterium]